MSPSDSRLAGNGFHRRRALSVVRTYPAKVAVTEQRRGDFWSCTATVNWYRPAEDGRSDSRDGGVKDGGSVKLPSRPVVRAVRDFPPFCGTNCPRLEKCPRDCGEDEQDKRERAVGSDNGGCRGVGVGIGHGEDDDIEAEEINGGGDVVDLEGERDDSKMGVGVGVRVGNGIKGPQPVRSIANKSLRMENLGSRHKPANGVNVVERDSAHRRPFMADNRFRTVEVKGKTRDFDAQRRQPLPENMFKPVGGDKDGSNRGWKRKFSSHSNLPMRTTDKGYNRNAPKPRAAIDGIRGVPRVGDRERVLDTLRLFRETYNEVSRQGDVKRVDIEAASRLKKMNKWINKTSKIVGAIPGVEVGHKFQYRMELTIIGLHNQNQSGIDYTYSGRQVIATSVVDSGGYGNYADGSGVLVYVGQGGNTTHSKKPAEDQKLERGNLALKNSIESKNLVRVTRKQPKHASSLHSRNAGEMYVYDGLYLVTKYWSELGIHGKKIFKFQMEKVAA